MNKTKFKAGDLVRCISTLEPQQKGYGWELNLVFTITRVDEYIDEDICFGGEGGNGVYSYALELASIKFNDDYSVW